ncbi:MAG TPA: winged helix-turn-helix domain-containing protein [Solirubrobacterales bacterium]|nr:winged helix-turn-helix domain-containing protein [Solirubrobacterales bacterium]
MAELSVRTLSPSQFVAEVGGELTVISRYFRQLARWGYVRVVEERPGRRSGAAIEHVYEGVGKAHFDTATWETVPRSGRDAVSRSILDSYFARIAEAVQAGTFDEDVDRHLSWDVVALDRRAWRQLGDRLDDVLAWLLEIAIDKPAAAVSETVPTVVGLASFRSPQPVEIVLKAPHREASPPALQDDPDPFGISPKMAKALSNGWRCRILMELTARPMSPSQFVEEIGGSLSHISRCFRELSSWGYVEVIEEKRGGRNGGGVERIYRNTRRAYFDTDSWESLPRLVRTEVSWSFLSSYHDRVVEAVEAGTFDAETDRHLSWTPLLVEQADWNQICVTLDEVLNWLPELERESVGRTRGDVDQLIPTTVGLTSFRSPRSGNNPN